MKRLALLFLFFIFLFPAQGMTMTLLNALSGNGFDNCKQGHVFRDAQNRFEVPCLYGKIERRDYGVVFQTGWGSDYAIAAYDIPEEASKEMAISMTKQGILTLLEDSQAKVKVIREEPAMHRKYKALNFDFIHEGRTYISRFIQTDNYVYWLYYSYGRPTDTIVQTQYDSIEEKFNQVKFENEFNLQEKLK